MSILIFLLCLSLASPLKIPKLKSDQTPRDPTASDDEPTTSESFLIREYNDGELLVAPSLFANEVFYEEGMDDDPQLEISFIDDDDLNRPGPSHGRPSEGPVNVAMLSRLSNTSSEGSPERRRRMSVVSTNTQNAWSDIEYNDPNSNGIDHDYDILNMSAMYEQNASERLEKLYEPPVLAFVSDEPLNFIENHFPLENAPDVPKITITPPSVSTSSNSSIEVLNTTSSTNMTSGYHSTSGDLNTTTSSNTTVDTSAEDDQDANKKLHHFLAMNFAYSPFDALQRIVQNKQITKLEDTKRLNPGFDYGEDKTADEDVQNSYLQDFCSSSVEMMSQKWEKYAKNLERPIMHSCEDGGENFKREELRIESIVPDDRVQLDREIEEWISLENQAVGKGLHGLTLLTSNAQGIQVDYFEMYEHIAAMCLFHWWNPQSSTRSTGLVIAQDTNLYWYELHDDNQITQLWYWTLPETINALKVFKIGDDWKLAASHQESYTSECASVVYGLNLWRNFWFEQRLSGCNLLTMAHGGKNFIVVDKDSSRVFVYRYNNDYHMYINTLNITSRGVQHISSFTAGPYSFLAVGGEDSAIYQLRGDYVVREQFNDFTLNQVRMWLPINVGYYRNDLILLTQHTLPQNAQFSNAVQILHWNGKRFVLMDHNPLTGQNEEIFGDNCMTNDQGLERATVLITVQGNIFIITANQNCKTNLFEIKTRMIETSDPVVEKLSSVQESFNKIKQKLLSQMKLAENKKQNIFMNTDNLRIKKIVAPAVQLRGNLKDFFKNNHETIRIAGTRSVNNLDLNLDITRLFDEIKTNHLRIKKLIQKVEKAVDVKNGLPKHLKNVKMAGKLIVNGKIQIGNANIKKINDFNVDRILKKSIENGVLKVQGKAVLNKLQVNNIDADVVNRFDVLKPSNNREPVLVYGDLNMQNHVKIINDVKLSDEGKLNDIHLNSDIYKAGKSLSDSPLNFSNLKINNLTVQSQMNNIFFTQEALMDVIENTPRNRQQNFFDEITVDCLSVGKDLQFETINGLNWKNFTERIILKSEDNHIDYLRVDGIITHDRDLKINYLNTLRFPDDYFLKNESEAVLVSGAKSFVSELYVGEVDCEGSINGIEHEKIVTLSSNQKLDNFTFYDLTVTERMNVEGDITGKELDAFLSNPLLTEAENIKSNIIFKDLFVNGSVKIENTINGTRLSDMFANVVEKSESQLKIDSTKTFQKLVTVNNGIQVKSGSINAKKIDEILTVDTDQHVFAENINGVVIFENIKVGGTFDGVNVTDLINNSINLYDNEVVDVTLILNDDLSMIEAKELNVTETLNNLSINDLNFKDDLKLNSPQFQYLRVDHLIVDGNIEKSQSLSGINLYNFDELRLSKTKNQIIAAPFSVKNANINELYFKYLNGKTNDEVYRNLKQLQNIENIFYNGNIPIRHLHVIGDLNVSFVNGINVAQMINEAVFLNRENIINAPITFLDRVDLKNLQIKGNAYFKNFDKFLNDVVRKHDRNITFEGRKTFMNGIQVEENVDTNFINQIEKTQILTAVTTQSVKRTMTVLGNTTSDKNIQIKGFLNDIPVNKFSESFIDLGNYTYKLNGNLSINNEDGLFVNNLIVKGIINKRYAVEEILNNVVYKSENNNYSNSILFNKPLVLNQGINVEQVYNGINVSKLIDDVVTINDDDYVNGNVKFEQPLEVDVNLTIHRNQLMENYYRVLINDLH